MNHTKAVDITIVVTTRNRAQMLRKALESLTNLITEEKFSYEILVVDDGSTDDTAKVVKDISNKNSKISIRWIYQEASGAGVARNKGIELSQGEWLLFFDDDQLAEPDWLAELYKTAQKSGAMVVGGPRHLALPDSPPLELGPKSRRILGEQRFIRHPLKDWIFTGNIIVHRSLFPQLGGFDNTFFPSTDRDFAGRVAAAGFPISYAPRAVVYHVIPESRIQRAYLRGICLRYGNTSARIYLKYDGPLKLAILNCWRIGVAVTRDALLLLVAKIVGDQPMLLDSWCGIWYSLGFVRTSLFLLSPDSFPQTDFFNKLALPWQRYQSAK